jgi:hypothetical protein
MTLIFKQIFISLCLLMSLNLLAADDVENLPREKSDAIDKHWEVVPSLKSISEKKFKGKKSEIHHSKDGTVFVSRSRNKGSSLLKLDSEDESQVVYNSKRKTIGHIQGTIIVTLKNFSDLAQIVSSFPVRIIRTEESISMVIFKIKPSNDLEKILNSLKNDSRIKNAEIEIVTKGLNPI